ncbi:ABC transporter, ATP-binding protein (cluster 5, nickel/peptides/opines) / ABC transporter, ATP-binding protein (cluster 5, nickel/peptides/opines) [hydrothermal vent metagenome]|uniref:ABC transporter, ATP-binding protein (Cluster 5, nickel/peptides/opines) / ABC transporter, ATP-binding protein (Cluster 5, nickel/peptides/opines) n=1 Tax=hydrothermal vent metagenome TaxID=652676 RepID=A0A3B0YZF4_9ZZZZ
MNDTLLKVTDLQTWIDTPRGVLRAVDGVSFSIRKGETFALLGESGCGKSMTALSIIGLVPEPAGKIVGGTIALDEIDLTAYSEFSMRNVRGNRVAMIFQEPMTSLNPVLTVGEQIGESLRRHKNLKGSAERARSIELLDSVGIPDPERRVKEYPHQLSGGMKQRVMIAIALAGDPDLLIADEPTTALDVTIQAQVLDLLKALQEKTGMAILLITHDLGVVYEMADHVAVMYAGQIVEQADRNTFFNKPAHPYSQRLFDSLPSMEKRHQMLQAIAGSVPPLTQSFAGCRFVERCDCSLEYCASRLPETLTVESTTNKSALQTVRCHLYSPDVVTQKPPHRGVNALEPAETSLAEMSDEVLLSVKNLRVHFPIHKGILKRVAGHVYAVDGVEIDIKPRQTLALVGESGCGKTTVGKGILQLLRGVTSGEVFFDNKNLRALKGESLRSSRADYQIIFQDPFSSMNPRMLVGDIIEEGMLSLGNERDPDKRQQRVEELLEMVGMSADMRLRYPHEFSGGQRQRICIARALAVNPKLIVCDEPTSALDVSVQAQILNLLKKLQQEIGLSYLFITHDISVVAYLADEIAVMYLGRIVERGTVEQVLTSPKHPYTKALLAAVPEINPENEKKKSPLQGDLPSPINPPQGCHFHPRCPDVMDKCKQTYPSSTEGQHRLHCHLFL